MQEVRDRTLLALGAHEFASLGNVLDQAELEVSIIIFGTLNNVFIIY